MAEVSEFEYNPYVIIAIDPYHNMKVSLIERKPMLIVIDANLSRKLALLLFKDDKVKIDVYEYSNRDEYNEYLKDIIKTIYSEYGNLISDFLKMKIQERTLIEIYNDEGRINYAYQFYNEIFIVVTEKEMIFVDDSNPDGTRITIYGDVYPSNELVQLKKNEEWIKRVYEIVTKKFDEKVANTVVGYIKDVY